LYGIEQTAQLVSDCSDDNDLILECGLLKIAGFVETTLNE